MLETLSIASSFIGFLVAMIVSLRTSIRLRKHKKDIAKKEYENLLHTYNELLDKNRSLSIELMNNHKEIESLHFLLSSYQNFTYEHIEELLSSSTTFNENNKTILDEQTSPQLQSQAITIHPNSPEKQNTTEE